MGELEKDLVWHLIVLFSSIHLVRSGTRPDFTGLEGPYCSLSNRRLHCCPGRQDECSVPIYGTLCYCDNFCTNRTSEDDCCPDYYTFCLGEEEPSHYKRAVCLYNGEVFAHGQIFQSNCNSCKCSSIGNKAEVLCERKRCMIDQQVLDQVNILQRSDWIARNYSYFWGVDLDDAIRLKLGTIDPSVSMCHISSDLYKMDYRLEDLPREFDCRTRWPGYISPVREQGWCGASWAVSTADVASDRFAIASNGAERVQLSAQHLLSCNRGWQMACKGGYLDKAWYFVRRFGLLDEECYPWQGVSGRCNLPRKTTLSYAGCRPRNSVSSELRDELYKTGSAYRVRTETDMIHEILMYGPLQATMRVYQDFFSYESGIYSHLRISENYNSDYHSVRIIGWGEEPSAFDGRPIKFWRVVNSWGREWGEDGYFRILRGTNECEIENFALAVEAKTY